MAFPSKQYGLLLPQKKVTPKPLVQRPSVFGDDSDDETSVGESLQKEAVKKRMMKQTRLEMQKALEQDSTVYDYDGVYDDIQQQRLESNKKVLGGADKKQEQLPQRVIGSEQGHYVESGELDQLQAGVSGGVQDGRISVAGQRQFWSCFDLPRAPKYINQLMKAVEERKKEQERRDDRKIQKEREAEGQQFSDKEAYVTSAYRQKLQERKEELEKEKREAAMEAALDVKKQRDLSGFYRHLLNQTVGEEEIPDRSVDKNESSKAAEVTERTSPLPSPTLPASGGDHGPSSHSDSEEGQDQQSAFSKPGTAATHAKRHYRQRSPASGSGEDEDKERDRDREKRGHRDRERDRGGREKHRERDSDRQRDRDRERDDRQGARRDDKDRRKERERERDREDDRSRGRKEAEREDRHGRRERSPKERERGKDGEREKRRDSQEDKGKGKERDKAKESRKEDLEKEKTAPPDTKKIDLEKEKTAPPDTKKIDLEKEKTTPTDTKKTDLEEKTTPTKIEIEIEAAGEGEKKVGEDSVEKAEKERVEEEEKVNKFAKRSSDQTVSSARDRYLARQMMRAGSKTYIEKEED